MKVEEEFALKSDVEQIATTVPYYCTGQRLRDRPLTNLVSPRISNPPLLLLLVNQKG